MATYRMEDGTILKTENAVASWNEVQDWNGNNHISRATRTQWEHQRLFKSRRGRYWIEFSSQWQGSLPRAEWVSKQQAAAWLLLMEHELPEDLREIAKSIEE